MEPSRRNRFLVIGSAVVLALLASYAVWMAGQPAFTVAPETTHITTHVSPQGLIDYPQALNEILREGVTHESNANVLIWQALGPHPEGVTMPEDYFQWLGIASPPEAGNYFFEWGKYVELHLKEPPVELKERFPNPPAWNQECYGWLDKASKAPWKEADYPDIATWLKENELPLAIMAEASHCEKYFNPLVSRSHDPKEARLIGCLLPSIQKCRGVAQALKCRAMLKLSKGDHAGAWQDLMTGRRLGLLLTQGATIIEALVGYAIISITIDGQAALVNSHPHSSKQVLAWLKELQTLPPMGLIADKINVGERFMMLDTMQSISASGMKSLNTLMREDELQNIALLARFFPGGIDYNPAFKKLNIYCDRLVEIMRMPDREARKNKVGQFVEEIKSIKAKNGIHNFLIVNRTAAGRHIGDLMLGLMMPSVDKFIESTDRSEQLQENLQVAFALAAYRADQGSYPARLADLAPKYLTKIPGDRFSEQSLIYKPTPKGYLLYSVGINQKDDGGQGYEDEPRGDDLRIRATKQQ